MVSVLTAVAGMVSAVIALQQIYWWQVKEYRWDRWWSFVQYNGGGREFWPRALRRPVVTWRTVVMGVVWVCVGITINTWWGWLAAAIAGPMMGVAVTSPFSFMGKEMLARRARKIMAGSGIKVIGITGSYGKTSSKEMLAFLVEEKFRTVKTLRNENTEAGIARRIIRAVKPDSEILILEIGAYRRGEIARVMKIAPLDIAWVTAIGNQHMDLFKSQENLEKAKFELVEGLKPEGVAVFNRMAGEENLIAWARERNIKSVVYGAAGRESNEKGAAEIAKWLGMGDKEIEERLAVFRKDNLWPKTVTTPGGVTVIDETYNANEQGFKEVVRYVGKNFPGRKYLVIPGIIELGEQTEAVHRRLAAEVKSWDGVWSTNKQVAGYLGGVGEENTDKLCRIIKATVKPGDVVVVVSRVPSKLKTAIWQL